VFVFVCVYVGEVVSERRCKVTNQVDEGAITCQFLSPIMQTVAVYIPIAIPPRSKRDDTPSEPRDSILPYPFGKRSVGGLSAKETVAKVMISETISVKA